MKKLTVIAALLASTLGIMGTAQAGGYQNQVMLQAVPTQTKVVVVDQHRQHKPVKPVKVIVVKKAAPHKKVKKVVVVKPKPVVKKKVVIVKPKPVVKKKVIVKKVVIVKPAAKKVVYIQKPAHHQNQVMLQAVHVK
ncbi:hypothetical protein [Thiofilum flexile]|uniref:hypothetical protein n=1 Tax=Thiofilum flexile TaxID=125627 RepID=UPI00036F8290|nr:hypothetical protein [Thiofilum flexile]